MMKKSCVVLLTYSGQSEVSSDWSIILVTYSWLMIGPLFLVTLSRVSDWSVMTSFYF